jgi:hypothetical protein
MDLHSFSLGWLFGFLVGVGLVMSFVFRDRS